MSSSVRCMSMSLDGYIACPNDDPGNRGGDGFGRLHDWFTTAHGGHPSGQALFISPETARTFVSRLVGKLDARDRAQLVVIAHQAGLVQPD